MRMRRRYNIAVERATTVRGQNVAWTVVLDGVLLGMVERCRTTGDYLAVHYDASEGRVHVDEKRHRGNPEGMSAAVGCIIATNDVNKMQLIA